MGISYSSVRLPVKDLILAWQFMKRKQSLFYWISTNTTCYCRVHFLLITRHTTDPEWVHLFVTLF